MHEGIDIAVPSGTPIRAVKAGNIVLAASTGGYGNYTCIDHGGGLSTCYAHQSSFARTSGSISQGRSSATSAAPATASVPTSTSRSASTAPPWTRSAYL